MLKQLLLLFLAIISTVAIRKNYVMNGDFTQTQSNVSLQVGRKLFVGSIPGWAGSIIEIGLGGYYNSNWDFNRGVMSLDTGSNQVFSQSLKLPSPGQYELTFDYASRQSYASSSTATVTLGTYTKVITPSDDSLHSTSMIVVISSGALTPQLTFTGTGLADGYGLTVANIQLTRANYIPNGDFELPVVTSSTTIYNGGIVGWVATSMSLSVGTSLNPNWFSGQIANTFSTSNSQFTATCRGMSSNTAYILSFNWGCPIAAGILSSVSANVLFNGNVVGALVCASVGISYQQIVVTASGSTNTVGFQGTSSASYGMGIDNVQLYEQS